MDLKRDYLTEMPSEQSRSMSSSLLIRLNTHDPDAWQRLVRLFYPLVQSWGQRLGLSVEDATDVTQEVFCILARNLSRFDRDGGRNSFRGWLWGITRREVLAYRRRQQCLPAAVGGSDEQRRFAEIPQPNSDESCEAVPTSQDEVVQRALALLRAEYEDRTWQAFWRTAIEGHSPAEVATDLGLSVNSVYLARSRILHRLREEFADLID